MRLLRMVPTTNDQLPTNCCTDRQPVIPRFHSLNAKVQKSGVWCMLPLVGGCLVLILYSMYSVLRMSKNIFNTITDSPVLVLLLCAALHTICAWILLPAPRLSSPRLIQPTCNPSDSQSLLFQHLYNLSLALSPAIHCFPESFVGFRLL